MKFFLGAAWKLPGQRENGNFEGGLGEGRFWVSLCKGELRREEKGRRAKPCRYAATEVVVVTGSRF